jgi:hypothetical protein
MDAAVKKALDEQKKRIDALVELNTELVADQAKVTGFLGRKFPASDAAWGEPETPETPEE